jgi:hypothetical protein
LRPLPLIKEGKDMNRITKMVLAAVGLVVLDQAAWAQNNLGQEDSAQSNCKDAEGNLVEVFNPGNNTAVGRLTHAGWLDGTTVATFNSGSLPTPDPNKVTFSSTITLTTGHGELKGRRVYLFDVVTGLGTDMSDIDGSASTGIFAGATGVIYVNAIKTITVAQGPYYSVVQGRICFAQGREPRDR